MNLKYFFDERTNTLTYIVYDPTTNDAIVIDPVLEYDYASSTFSETSIIQLRDFIYENELHVHYILETHAHADHISGAQFLKSHLPNAKVAISEHIKKVQSIFKDYFNFPSDFPTDGSQFDRLLKDQERITAGSLHFDIIYTPGHTPACCSFKIQDRVFSGDALFIEDFGVARCDFPGGSAKELYESVKNRLYTLKKETKIHPAHDYQPNGRSLRYETTIKDSLKKNIHINENTTKDEFVAFRNKRDKSLKAPNLLLPSIQININAGNLPPKESNGMRYLKIPLKPKAE